MAPAFDVELDGGGRARAVRVVAEDGLDEALVSLGLSRGPVVLLFGGAGKVAVDDLERIRAFFRTSFIPAMERIGGIVIDGGTDAGVMRIAGEERVRAGGRIRMIGVAPFAKVKVPGSPGSTALAPGHTDFVLVPGTDWGSEASWFHLIADRLTTGPSATVLVNGGPIALDEIEQSIDLGRRVIVIDGTGRAADDLAVVIGRSSDSAMDRAPSDHRGRRDDHIDGACRRTGQERCWRTRTMSATTSGQPGTKSLERLVDELDLSDDEKTLLRSRWLDQMHWMGRKARIARRRHLALRWIIACGGIILPVLVSFSLGAALSKEQFEANAPVRVATFVVSLAIALLATTEEVFHFGDTWHHYRRTAELAQERRLAIRTTDRAVRQDPTHAAALPAFTRRIEDILSENVEEYFGRVVAEDTKPGGTNLGSG